MESTQRFFSERDQFAKHNGIELISVDVKDDAGDLVAVFQGLVYRKPDKLPIGS